MSLYRWFAIAPKATELYLPDEESEKDTLEVEAANDCLEKELGRKRRGPYNNYDPEFRAKIGKYAAQHCCYEEM